MLVLVVDSATPAVTAALAEVDGGGVTMLAQRVTVDARAHGELLAPQVAEVLTEVGARPRDLRAIVAGTGPGPFTGLRVGLVTAAGMGQALTIPVYGVCTLDAFPYAVPPPTPLLVATDARRREIYWALYSADRQRLIGPAVDLPAAVAERVRQVEAAVALGDGAHRYAEQLGLPVLDEPRYPPAAGLVAVAAERIRGKAPADRLTPLYLRRPDALEPGTRKPALR